MEDFLLCVIVLVLFIRWVVMARRYDEIERRFKGLDRDRIDPREISRLIKRVSHLEDSLAALQSAPVVTKEAAPVAPVAPQPVAPEPEPVVVSIPAAAAPEPPKPESATEPVVTPPPLIVRPMPTPAGPARPSRTGAEWEALVGGNWLNKLGVLVLVISLALFLGYAFPRLGPVGISAISLALSLTMLAGGVALERRARYVIFGRGLIAGGWAGLYFTTYAMQALDAARVIHSELLGAVLLLAVAGGMVAHSLRYREQTLTGLAYFMAFATLAITPVTALSVIALIPLAGSLLAIAYRFEWPGMALFGAAATYATCATKPDTGAPLWQAQAVFTAYWLLFEAYDLLRVHRRSNHPAQQAMLPLNALGFGLLSYVKWSHAAPNEIYMLTIGVAAAYVASTVLRAILRPPSSFAPEEGTWARVLAGAFEGPVTLAAAASAAAAILKLHGQTVNVVLLAEGELLFLCGLYFRQSYPRRLAATVFAALGVKLFVTDIPAAAPVNIAGRTLRDWTPSAALATALFYLNRGLRKTSLAYGYAASALLALIIGYEIPLQRVGICWLALAAILFMLGWGRRLPDFRLQGYVGAMLAVGGIAFYQFAIVAGGATPWPHPWISLACAAAISYAAVVCALRSGAGRFTPAEREHLQFTAAAIASAAAAALLWKVAPQPYLGPAWMALALALLELGLRRMPPEFRRHAYLLGALGAGSVLLASMLPLHPIAQTDQRIAIGSAALLAYLLAARLFTASPSQAPAIEKRRAIDIASAGGSLFALVELWALLDPVLVAPAWALYALLLTAVGFRFDLASLRAQGHAASLAALGRLFAVNFDAAYRIPSVAVAIAAHYFESWRHGQQRERLRSWERSLDRPYLYTAAGLIALLLFRELPAPFVALGWAALALALLAVSRAIDLRDLRYQSFGLAALAFARALVLEFGAAQVFTSIEERILAGSAVAACLLAAQFLLPRERTPRLYYSLLTTLLVTALLFQEVSGSMLTVAWGIEGAVLLGLGFPLRDRTFRLSGLVLFLVCVGKLFAYDLRALETLYRILSFFVLGVILVGVSWLYTRFRDQIQRYL